MKENVIFCKCSFRVSTLSSEEEITSHNILTLYYGNKSVSIEWVKVVSSLDDSILQDFQAHSHNQTASRFKKYIFSDLFISF